VSEGPARLKFKFGLVLRWEPEVNLDPIGRQNQSQGRRTTPAASFDNAAAPPLRGAEPWSAAPPVVMLSRAQRARIDARRAASTLGSPHASRLRFSTHLRRRFGGGSKDWRSMP